MIGRTLAHYRVLEILGEGGMGTVYLAEDTRLGRRVAIKVIQGAAHTHPANRARFLQEARAASALDHPHIGAIYQIDETEDGVPFLVMAHYEGETLDRRIAAGPMRVGEAIQLAAQVADGLAHAHARGVIHRDIKPSNVMRTNDGVVKILDFGLAKVLGADSMTVTGVSIGTPGFMSPEQVRSEPVDARSDVWAVGVMLYALLAGRSPFEADNLAATTYAILEGHPTPLREIFPRVPDGLQEILDRCMAKDPSERYPDARALAADLHALAARLGSDDALTLAATATSGARTLVLPPSSRRTTAVRRGSPRLMVGALVLVLAAGAIAGVFAWRRAHPPEPVRVAVLAPDVGGEPDSSAAAVAAADALAAILRGLASFEGLAPLDAASLRGVRGWRETVGALSADEAFSVALVRAGEEWNVSMRRVGAADSSVRWAGSFAVPRGAALPFYDAVRAQLARAYADHRLRPGEERVRIDAATYEDFLDLERHFRRNFAQDVPHAEMLDRVMSLRRRAPEFIGIPLLGAEWARYQFETNRDLLDLELALESARQAREIAPDDPRPHVAEFHARMLKTEWDAAGRSLDELRRLIPTDPDVEFLSMRLLEGRGEREPAIAGLKRLIARRPARTYLERLARMQYNGGHYDDARVVLNELAARFPGYVFPRSYRAQLELLYGSPQSAESLYSALASQFPSSVYRSNLGLAQMLQGKFSESERSIREAIALTPGKPASYLNLGDCQWLSGKESEAKTTYREVIRMIESSATPNSSESRLSRAQCLAHLGRQEEAVALTVEALRTEGENPDAQFQAALVYAVGGEATSAIVHARKAIEAGIQPRWFQLPWFDALRGDARFQQALRGDAKHPS